jgi:hypothetical protein
MNLLAFDIVVQDAVALGIFSVALEQMALI